MTEYHKNWQRTVSVSVFMCCTIARNSCMCNMVKQVTPFFANFFAM